MKKKHWLWVAVVSLSIFTAAMFTIASMSFTFMSKSDQTWMGYLPLWARIVLMIVFWLLWFTGLVFLNWSKNHLLRILMMDYKKKIYQSISFNVYENMKTKQVGELENAFLKDAEIIRQKKYTSTFNVIFGLSSVICTAIALTIFSPWLLLITVGLTLLVFMIMQVFRKKMVWIQNQTSTISATYGTGLLSLLKGLPTFFSYNKLQEYEKRNAELNEEYEEKNLDLQTQNLTVNTGLQVAKDASSVLLMVLTALLLSFGFINAGVFLAVGNLGGSFMYRAGASVGDFMAIKSTKEIQKRYEFLGDEAKLKHLFKAVNEIEFKNAQVSYGDKVIINDFNKTFTNDKNYLIKGPSGSGKSTLVKTLVGLNKISDGKLLVNGVEINDDNIAELRDKIAYIDQNIYLFDASLAYNIALDDDYDEARIKEILHEVNLDSFLDRSLKENIGGDLEKISGGEKRRIGLARAIYANKEIFIVDETTSNLDPANKDAIEKLILEQKDKLILLISHDLTAQNQSLIQEIVEVFPNVKVIESEEDNNVTK